MSRAPLGIATTPRAPPATPAQTTSQTSPRQSGRRTPAAAGAGGSLSQPSPRPATVWPLPARGTHLAEQSHLLVGHSGRVQVELLYFDRLRASAGWVTSPPGERRRRAGTAHLLLEIVAATGLELASAHHKARAGDADHPRRRRGSRQRRARSKQADQPGGAHERDAFT
eukprot:scaffold6430_cov133-Isochrysis_galbana.AAC.6